MKDVIQPVEISEITDLTRGEIMALPVLECLKLGMRAHKVFRERILATFPPGFSEVESKVRLCETLYGDEVDIKGFEESLRKAAERDARKETQSR